MKFTGWSHSNKRLDRSHKAVLGRQVEIDRAADYVYDGKHPGWLPPPVTASYCAVCNQPLTANFAALRL